MQIFISRVIFKNKAIKFPLRVKIKDSKIVRLTMRQVQRGQFTEYHNNVLSKPNFIVLKNAIFSQNLLFKFGTVYVILSRIAAPFWWKNFRNSSYFSYRSKITSKQYALQYSAYWRLNNNFTNLDIYSASCASKHSFSTFFWNQ